MCPRFVDWRRLLILSCATSLLAVAGCASKREIPTIHRPSDEEEEASAAAAAAARAKRAAADHKQDDDKSESTPRRPKSTATTASDSTPPPSAPPSALVLTADQRKVASQLAEIGAAIMAYSVEKGHFPPGAIYDDENKPGLSWRVEILPYLGYMSVYEEFDRKLPYHYAKNRAPRGKMPSVFITPASRGLRTQFRAITGSGTCFPGRDGTAPDKIFDGLDQTIILVCAPAAFDQEWVQPDGISVRELPDVLETSKDGLLALWADGRVGLIPQTATASQLSAAASIDKSDRSTLWESAMELVGPASPSAISAAIQKKNAPPPEEFAANVPTKGGDDADDESSSSRGGPTGLVVGPDAGGSGRTGRNNSNRKPLEQLPVEEQRQQAMQVVRQMFLNRYQDADRDGDKRLKKEIAEEMVAKANRLGEDLAGKYVMLTAAQRIAMEVDDVKTAQKALDGLMDTFEIDVYEMRLELLNKASRLTERSTFDTKLMDDAKWMIDEAIRRDEYKGAMDMVDVAQASARRLKDYEEGNELTRKEREVQKLRATYERVKSALADADNTQSPQTHELVGRYFGLMKGEWEKGLPHLAQCDDADLRRLAQRDLESPVDAQAQLQLADGWWARSESARSPEDEHLRRRAVFWYDAALKNLPQGLARLKAQERVKELNAAGNSRG